MGRRLGSLALPTKTTVPTLGPGGGSLVEGQVIMETTEHRPKIYSGSAWKDLIGADADNGQAGVYAGSPWNTGVSALTASTAYGTRFVPTRDMTIISIAFSVTVVSGVDVNCDVGIYSSILTTRIVASTAAAGSLNSIGVKNISIASTVLSAGTVYYACMSVASITGSPSVLGCVFGGNTPNSTKLFGTGVPQIECFSKSSSHPLPSSLASPNGNPGATPLFALREA